MSKLCTAEIAQKRHTVKDFYRLVPDGQKADLIDGTIYMASPDSTENDDIGGFLYTLMRMYAEIKNLGRISGSRFAYKLTEYSCPEPDVAFVRRERLGLIGATGMDGAPDIAVEIVAAESEDRDYVDKKNLYQEAGVVEYWLINPSGVNVEFYRLIEGRYELIPLEEGRMFRSSVLDGFWLDSDWLFSKPRRVAYARLQEILAQDVR